MECIIFSKVKNVYVIKNKEKAYHMDIKSFCVGRPMYAVFSQLS